MPRRRQGEETRHGATQPEEERAAKKLTLRLLPADRRRLEAHARAWGVTLSEAVARLVREHG